MLDELSTTNTMSDGSWLLASDCVTLMPFSTPSSVTNKLSLKANSMGWLVTGSMSPSRLMRTRRLSAASRENCAAGLMLFCVVAGACPPGSAGISMKI
jgi:hypothetical protein